MASAAGRFLREVCCCGSSSWVSTLDTCANSCTSSIRPFCCLIWFSFVSKSSLNCCNFSTFLRHCRQSYACGWKIDWFAWVSRLPANSSKTGTKCFMESLWSFRHSFVFNSDQQRQRTTTILTVHINCFLHNLNCIPFDGLMYIEFLHVTKTCL